MKRGVNLGVILIYVSFFSKMPQLNFVNVISRLHVKIFCSKSSQAWKPGTDHKIKTVISRYSSAVLSWFFVLRAKSVTFDRATETLDTLR